MINSKIRKLSRVFEPRTVAFIGATEREKSVGLGIIKNLMLGQRERKIFYVNPYQKEIFGKECYPKITSIKEKIDLAIIAIPALSVLETVKECVAKKVGGIIIISSNFGETGEAGKALEKQIKKALQNSDIPLIGPNCLGVLNTANNLNASFAPLMPKPGDIALLSQSGAMVDAILDKSSEKNFGFSKIISYGNELDLELDEFLEYLKRDEETKIIAIYFEAIKDGLGFLKTARAVSKIKPIVAIKSGRGEAGQKAALTHTGSLSSDYQIYKAILKQTGIIQVESLDELLDVIKVLSFCPRPRDGIGIITNGGGLGVLAADFCEEMGITMPQPNEKTIQKLNRGAFLRGCNLTRNPLDLMGDALSERYEAALEAMLAQPDIRGVLVLQGAQIMTEPLQNAKIILRVSRHFPSKPVVCCMAGGVLVREAISFLEKNKIPNYTDPKRAVQALRHLIIK